jgi:hypothetical protein
VQKHAAGRNDSERAKVRVLCFVWVGTVGDWLTELVILHKLIMHDVLL